MESTWFVLILTTCLASVVLKAFLSMKQKSGQPPGPRGFPVISSIKWLTKSVLEIEAILAILGTKFGPVISIPVDGLSVVVILGRELAHEALVRKGAVFSDRPKHISPAITEPNILLARYGPAWRTLRRNLASHILHTSRLKEKSWSRKVVLDNLVTRLGSASAAGLHVKVVDHFQFAISCLLVRMCFGDELEECKIREVVSILMEFMESVTRFQILNFWPRLTRFLLPRRWEEFCALRKRQQEVLIPLVNNSTTSCYASTLLNLEIEDDDGLQGKRKLKEEEVIIPCLELLGAGIDTTTTALQWIMANLVKHPHIQTKLFDEIKGVVGIEAEQVKEENLPNMPYLKAVILEGLRRHPPFHFTMPHSVSQEVELGGYVIPKDAIVNFPIAMIGWDPKVWEDPMEFKPERFINRASSSATQVDITGSCEIKMMPFGAGRRICPGLGFAILHLEYFVANLVWKFEWASKEGHEVDLEEKQEFTVVMKHPLHACISSRKLQ